MKPEHYAMLAGAAMSGIGAGFILVRVLGPAPPAAPPPDDPACLAEVEAAQQVRGQMAVDVRRAEATLWRLKGAPAD